MTPATRLCRATASAPSWRTCTSSPTPSSCPSSCSTFSQVRRLHAQQPQPVLLAYAIIGHAMLVLLTARLAASAAVAMHTHPTAQLQVQLTLSLSAPGALLLVTVSQGCSHGISAPVLCWHLVDLCWMAGLDSRSRLSAQTAAVAALADVRCMLADVRLCKLADVR